LKELVETDPAKHPGATVDVKTLAEGKERELVLWLEKAVAWQARRWKQTQVRQDDSPDYPEDVVIDERK
jgi:hypothetical protein